MNGGDLFGEGHVDGLKAIRDLQTPVNAQHPDFGAKVNQLMVTFAGPEGRQALLKRFANNSFGTINFLLSWLFLWFILSCRIRCIYE